MSTQPEAGDLDRTDELPQLDVVAYEAAHAAESADVLSTTDTWLVESFPEHEDDTLARTRQIDTATQAGVRGGVDLSLNVERLRQRIGTLESELATALLTAREAEATSRAASAERNELTARLVRSEAQAAHLHEQQSFADARVKRTQEELREQSETYKADLASAAAAREAERLSAEQQRLSLEQQLERAKASLSNVTDEQARTRQALEDSRELAVNRARQIDELQRTASTEHDRAHALGRNLAAKLADYDIMSAMVAQRNTTITTLEEAREQLDDRLQKSLAEVHRLSASLEDANQRAAASDRYVAEITTRDERLTQLQVQIDSLRDELQQSLTVRGSLEENLRQAAADAKAGQERQQTLMQQISEQQSALAALALERDKLLGTREELAERSAQLAQATADLADAKGDATSAWSELETQSELASKRKAELAAAHTAIEELQSANEALRQRIEQLNTTAREEAHALSERTAELARARGELKEFGATVQGMEVSLRARDTLIENLRADMGTAQDERNIMSGQLAKARSRVKAMTQQIFNRDNRIAALQADLAVHVEALAAIRQDVDRLNPDVKSQEPLTAERCLEPVNHDGEPILLNRRVMTIGRTHDNDIFIPSKMISRHHARLLVGPNGVIVEDAGSTNGCFVNDQQIRQHVLHEGDILTLGDMKYRLSMRSEIESRGAGPDVSVAEVHGPDD